jgi:Aspartyl/Asparaginyl beta-hydroxylase
VASKIGMTALRFDVERLKRELEESPEVWNEIPFRTRVFEGSPHREVDDVWVRYNHFRNFNGDWAKFHDRHESEWYKVCEKIPSARRLSRDLANALQTSELGGVLLTRVPAGKQVYPHRDQGWHAGYYEKFVIQIVSAPGQMFCFEDEELNARPGECYWFDNSYLHWVKNPTEEDRVSLIVCVRREKCHLVG